MKKIAFLCLMVFFLSGCSRQGKNWVGFYFPEGEPTVGKATCTIKEFDTQDICEKWAKEQKGDNIKADSFCGFQCRYDSSCQYGCIDKK